MSYFISFQTYSHFCVAIIRDGLSSQKMLEMTIHGFSMSNLRSLLRERISRSFKNSSGTSNNTDGVAVSSTFYEDETQKWLSMALKRDGTGRLFKRTLLSISEAGPTRCETACTVSFSVINSPLVV